MLCCDSRHIFRINLHFSVWIYSTEGLDELDIRILEALQRNARSTFTELGTLVGLKAPAVHDRVKRLEGRGYIRGYGAKLDARPPRLAVDRIHQLLHVTRLQLRSSSPAR